MSGYYRSLTQARPTRPDSQVICANRQEQHAFRTQFTPAPGKAGTAWVYDRHLMARMPYRLQAVKAARAGLSGDPAQTRRGAA
jgi:hypothetical protein